MKKLIFTALTLTLLATGLRAAEMDTLRVYFDNGQTAITNFQQGLIDIFLTTHFAQGQMIIAGHSDDLGDNTMNLNNSRTRAKIVAEYLVAKGLDAEKLLIEAWGETKPIVPNNNAINCTKNRRVEIIGLPYRNQRLEVTGLSAKPITLSNGTPIKYKEMTTMDGKKKYVFTIVLRKGDEIVVDTNLYYAGQRGPGCGGYRPDEVVCPNLDPFIHKIQVAENFRCPLDQFAYIDKDVDTQKNADHDKYFVFAPKPEDSAYYFMVPLNGITACDTLGYAFGKECYTLHDARIVFQGLKVNYLKGKCSPMRESQVAKRQPDGSYLLQYTDEEPENLKLFGQVMKGKRKKMAFKNVSLDQLTFDAARDAYIATPKNVKRLRKQ